MKIKKLTEKEFCECMDRFVIDDDFDKFSQKWLNCFAYMLFELNKSFTDEVIIDLFENFEMNNAKIFCADKNSFYKKYERRKNRKRAYEESFSYECQYIFDRFSYDRIFRVHWIYNRLKLINEYGEKNED